MHATTRSRDLTTLRASLVVPVASFVAAFVSILYMYPHDGYLSRDSSAYIFIADGMLKGRIPFVQLWENKGLPLYAIDMLGRVMTPARYTGIWVLELLFMWLAFFIVIWVLRRFASLGATILATVLFVLGVMITGDQGNVAELWNLPVQACGLVVAWLLISGTWPAKRWVFVLAGFAAGFSGMMKINLLGTWIAVFGLIVALAVSKRVSVRDALLLLGRMAAGFLAAVILSVGPVVAWGATQQWWDEWLLFGLNLAGNSSSRPEGTQLAAVWQGISRLTFIAASLVAGALGAGVGWFARSRPRIDSERVWMGGFLLAWLGIELWASSINGQSYPYYNLPWLIPAVSLLGLVLGDGLDRRTRLVLATAAAALGIWYCLPGFNARLDLHRGFPPVVFHEDSNEWAVQKRMIREVNKRTSPSDTVLIWGMDTVVFDDTGRLSASRYGHPLDILLTRGYQSEARFSGFMNELEAHPPRLIIDSSFIKLQNRLSIQDLRVAAPLDTTSGRVEPYMRALPDFVDAHYRLVAKVAAQFPSSRLDAPKMTPYVKYYEYIGN